MARAFISRDGKSVIVLSGSGPYRVEEYFLEKPETLNVKDPGEVELWIGPEYALN